MPRRGFEHFVALIKRQIVLGELAGVLKVLPCQIWEVGQRSGEASAQAGHGRLHHAKVRAGAGTKAFQGADDRAVSCRRRRGAAGTRSGRSLDAGGKGSEVG